MHNSKFSGFPWKCLISQVRTNQIQFPVTEIRQWRIVERCFWRKRSSIYIASGSSNTPGVSPDCFAENFLYRESRARKHTPACGQVYIYQRSNQNVGRAPIAKARRDSPRTRLADKIFIFVPLLPVVNNDNPFSSVEPSRSVSRWAIPKAVKFTRELNADFMVFYLSDRISYDCNNRVVTLFVELINVL